MQEMSGLPAATDEEAMEDLLRRHGGSLRDDPDTCFECGVPLAGLVSYGAGDGRGQRFRCYLCQNTSTSSDIQQMMSVLAILHKLPPEGFVEGCSFCSLLAKMRDKYGGQ